MKIIHLSYKPEYFEKGFIIFIEDYNEENNSTKILTRQEFKEFTNLAIFFEKIDSLPFFIPTYEKKILGEKSFNKDLKKEDITFTKNYLDCGFLNFTSLLTNKNDLLKSLIKENIKIGNSFEFYILCFSQIIKKHFLKENNIKIIKSNNLLKYYLNTNFTNTELFYFNQYCPKIDITNVENNNCTDLLNKLATNLNTTLFDKFIIQMKKDIDYKKAHNYFSRLLCLPNIENDFDNLNTLKKTTLQPLLTFKSTSSLEQELSEFWNINFLLKDNRKKISFDKIIKLKPTEKSFYINFYLFQIKRILELCPELEDAILAQKTISITSLINFFETKALKLIENGIKIQTPVFLKNLLKPKVKIYFKKSTQSISSGMLAHNELLNFDWRLSIGEHSLTETEIEELLRSNKNVIKIGDNYMALDKDFLRKLLKKIKQEKEKHEDGVNLFEALNYSAEFIDEDDISIESFSKKQLSLNTLASEDFNLPSYTTGNQFLGDLRHYQEEGVRLITLLERLGFGIVLADDMGLGKTVQIIALLTQKKAKQINTEEEYSLIITPATLLYNWENEFKKFTKNLSIYTHYGPRRLSNIEDLQKHKIILSSYGIIKKDFDLFSKINFKRIIIDEAQNIKNINSEQTRIIKSLKAQTKIALTGTPIENRLLELWSIMDFCNTGLLRGHKYFISHYENPIAKDKNKEKINKLKNVISPFIIRRMKTDKSIIKELPPRQESNIYIPLTEEQITLYDKVIKDVEQKVSSEDKSSNRGIMLSTITKLKHICNHPELFLENENPSQTKLIQRSGKFDRLAQMAMTIESEGRKMLIFSQYVDTLELIQSHLSKILNKKTLLFHGGLSLKKRNQTVEEFENSPDVSCMLLSIRAGGFGLNLTAANYVLHYDRWWNPAVENQAIDRVYRIGQKRKTFVYKFICKGTLEENIHKLINSKIDLSNSIITEKTSILKDISSEEFINLIKRG